MMTKKQKNEDVVKELASQNLPDTTEIVSFSVHRGMNGKVLRCMGYECPFTETASNYLTRHVLNPRIDVSTIKRTVELMMIANKGKKIGDEQ